MGENIQLNLIRELSFCVNLCVCVCFCVSTFLPACVCVAGFELVHMNI